MSCTAPRPSVALWWVLTAYPALPPSSPSTSSTSHSGRSRSNGRDANSCTTSRSWRTEPGASSLVRLRWRDRSRSSTVTQVGEPTPSAGSTTRWRIRETIRDAHSCAPASRSQSGARSRISSSVTFDRSRGSAASPRHIAVSSGFISGAVPHSSGAATGPRGPVVTSTAGLATRRGPVLERVEVQPADVLDVLVQLLDRPAVRRDRRVHDDLHRALADRGRAAPHQLARVADHHRHDRHPGLHRDVEGALLERPERRGRRAGALRRDHQRDALPQPLDRRLEGRPGLRGVAAVDEGDVGEAEHQPEPRNVRRLLLRHAGEPAAQQLGEDQHVELALVVEQEHRGPGGPPGSPHPGRRGGHRRARHPAPRRAWCPGRWRRAATR